MRQVIWKFDGYRIRQDREWEQTRYIAAILINAHSKKKVKPQDLIPLSIDKTNKRVITQEEKELIKKNWLNGNDARTN